MGTRRRELVREYEIEVAYAAAGRLETDLRASGVTVLDTTYETAVTLRIGAPPAEEKRLESLLAELTAGTSVLVPGEDQWVDVP